MHLENEAASEALRQRLDSRKKFNLEKIFFAIDYDQDGFLDEIDVFFLLINFKISNSDALYLMIVDEIHGKSWSGMR